jgi:hypothetical protein
MPKGIGRHNFTAEMKGEVSELHQSGLTATQIACKMVSRYPSWPRMITRNMIMGIVHRSREKGESGFPLREIDKNAYHSGRPPSKPNNRPPRDRITAQRGNRGSGDSAGNLVGRLQQAMALKTRVAASAALKKLQEGEAFAVPEERTTKLKNLFELQPGECKMPIDDPNETLQMFCAAPCGDWTYCEAHGRGRHRYKPYPSDVIRNRRQG